MKIGHISDTHLGYEMYNMNERREDFFDAFKQGIEIFKENNVDVIIHTGDLFNGNSPSASTLNDFLSILLDLKSNGINFMGIVGNHEKRRDLDWLDHFEDLDLCTHLSQTPVKEDSVCFYGFDNINDQKWNDSLELDKDGGCEFNIVATHNIFEPPVSEIFSDYNFEEFLNKLNLNPDLVLAGDYHEKIIHKEEDVQILYTGSTEKTSFDESENFVSIINIEDGSFDINPVKLENRRFIASNVDENFEEEKFRQKISTIIEKNEKSPIIKLKISSGSNNINYQHIKSLCENLGVLDCRIEETFEEDSDEEIDVSSLSNSEEEILEEVEKKNFRGETRKIISLCVSSENVGKKEDVIRERIEEILEETDN